MVGVELAGVPAESLMELMEKVGGFVLNRSHP